MNVRKASDNSRGLRTHDAFAGLPPSRPVREGGQDNTPDALMGISHESISAFQSNAMLAVKARPTILATRKESSVMQSCWIQRLNPSCQGHKCNEEQTDHQAHVWTHFTKDFSSCSKRLDKSPYHARSSSWPPPELLHMKKTAPEDFVGIDANAGPWSVRVTHNNVFVPSGNAIDEGDLSSKAGSLFIREEALVPHSWYRGPAREESSLPCYNDDKVSAAQLVQFQSKDAKEENRGSKSHEIARVSGHAYTHGRRESSSIPHRTACMGIFSLDTNSRASFSPAIMGASADADCRKFLSACLRKDIYTSGNNSQRVSSSFQSSPNGGEAGGLAEVNSRFGKTGSSHGQKRENVSKSGKNFGFFHPRRYSEGAHPTSLEHPLSRSLCDVGAPNTFGYGIKDVKHVAFNTYTQGNKNADPYACASDARPSVVVNKGVPPSLNKAEFRRANDLFSLEDVQGIEASKVFLMRDTPSQHKARATYKKTSLDDYLEHFFRGHEDRKPLETASSTASLPQEYITRQYNKSHITSRESPTCFYGNDKVNIPLNFTCQGTSSAHIEAFGSKSAWPPLSPKNGLVQTERMGCGNKQCLGETEVAGPHSEREFHVIDQQHTHKESRDVGLPFDHQSYTTCDVERTWEASIPNEPWIKRWCSTSSLSVLPEKMSSSSSRKADDKLGSDQPMAYNFKGRSKLTYVGTSTNPCNEAGKSLPGYVNYASGSAPKGPFPTSKICNITSFSSKYAAPSAQAMGIVGSAASRLDGTSRHKRGFSSMWPCPGAIARRHGEHGVGAGEDKLHVLDLKDLKEFGA